MTELFGVVRSECRAEGEEDVYHCTGWLGLTGHSVADAEILARNLGVLRQDAPYAYLFVNGFETALEARAAVAAETDFELPGRTLRLRRGIWLSYPFISPDPATVVIDVGTRDISPFIRLLEDDEFSLLCLPHPRTLEQLDDETALCSDKSDLVYGLLCEGGFIANALDGVALRIRAVDPTYRRYFPTVGERPLVR